jgi:formylmethanofuran dehydrogenase subunit E
MSWQKVLLQDDFKKCLEFHGHLCPGLAIGYRAARAGLDWLNERRAVDEELVAIVETDACGADAIQVLTGCTFGKGNFIFRDHGKNVYSFVSRSSGSGVRVSVRAGSFQPSERHMELIEKIRDADIIVVNMAKFDEEVIAACEKCKLLIRHGIGYDNVDVAACTKHGIRFAYMPDYCCTEVAEQAVALIFACARKLLTRRRLREDSRAKHKWAV